MVTILATIVMCSIIWFLLPGTVTFGECHIIYIELCEDHYLHDKHLDRTSIILSYPSRYKNALHTSNFCVAYRCSENNIVEENIKKYTNYYSNSFSPIIRQKCARLQTGIESY